MPDLYNQPEIFQQYSRHFLATTVECGFQQDSHKSFRSTDLRKDREK
jgi:hypothetical protein